MKKTLKFFSMATLLLAVATLTGCGKDDDISAEPAVVKTCTTTVSIEGNEASKALTEAGVKTFEAGEQIAVVYEKTSGTLVKKVITLTAGDISNAGKNATISLEMTNPKASGTLRIIYPAAMAGTNDVDYSKLYTQNGTLDQISSQFDLGLYNGNLTAGAILPASPALTNPLTICKFTLKNEAGSGTLTGITALYIGDGENFYMVTPASATNAPLWVAMKPVSSSQWITFHATDGTHKYEKEVTGKTLTAGHMTPLGLKMKQLQEGALWGTFSVANGVTKHFSQGNLQATINWEPSRYVWIWSFATHQYDYIGNAVGNTIVSGNYYQIVSGTVDLFGWSTSSTYYGIHNSTDYNTYLNSTDFNTYALDFVDWGNNAISNGGNVANAYSTLSTNNWDYLISERSGYYGKSGTATVCDQHGYVLLPDHWTLPTGCSFSSGSGSWTRNNYTAAQWAKMEAAGAVFLPAAGRRNGKVVNSVGDYGYYWTSSAFVDNLVRAFHFNHFQYSLFYDIEDYTIQGFYPYNGFSVRLVCN